MSDDSLTAIYTTKNPSEAEVVRMELEGNGIPAVVSGGRQAGFSGAMDIDVMVRAEDAVRAREFLTEHLARPMSEQEVEQAEEEDEKSTGGEQAPEAR